MSGSSINQESAPLRQTPAAAGRVCAVVVTYNRLETLKICLEGVRNQSRPVDHILVVDNGSTDGTAQWLASQTGLEVIRQGNLGNAGGQATGMAAALAQGYDWMWCMDDDVTPLPEALAIQLAAGQKHDLVVSYKQYQGNRIRLGNWFCGRNANKINRPLTGGLQPVNFGHFEGMLIARRVVDKIGLPDQRTFIWGEDVLYGYAAHWAGFSCVLPPETLFDKLLPETDERTSLGALYFRVRNRFLFFEYIRKAEGHPWMGYLRYISYLLRQTGRALRMAPEQRRKRLRIIRTALEDAAAGRWEAGRFFEVMSS